MIKLAQIGYGYWGKNLLRNFVELPDCDLVLVCDRNAREQETLARKYRHVEFTTEAKIVLEHPDLEAIAIATPLQSHFELALQALQHGKHVFVEKPLAASAAQCQTLIEAAKSGKRKLMVGHTFLYNNAVRQIRAYLQEHFAGEIYYLYSQRLNLGIVRQDVDAMWNFAPHDLAILSYWLDEQPAAVSARGEAYLQRGIADVAFMTLRYPSGVTAHLHLSWLDPGKVRRMTIVGSRRMIVYDDVHPDNKIRIFDKGIEKENLEVMLGDFDSFGKFQMIHRAGDVILPKLDLIEPLQVQCQHFLDCIRHDRQPLSGGREGLEVVRVLEAGRQSMQQDGKTIRLD